MIVESQGIRAIGIADAVGVRRQGLAHLGRASDGHRAAGRVIDRVYGQGCRGGRGTEGSTVGDAEGEGRIAVGIERRGIDQSRNIGNGNHLGCGDRCAAQGQAAQAGGGGQAIDAYLLQGVAGVGIGKIKLGDRKSVGGILVCADRQPAGGGRVIDRSHGQGCRGGRGTEGSTVGDAEGEGRIAVDIGHRGIDQIRNIPNRNRLPLVNRCAAQRQAAVGAVG